MLVYKPNIKVLDVGEAKSAQTHARPSNGAEAGGEDGGLSTRQRCSRGGPFVGKTWLSAELDTSPLGWFLASNKLPRLGGPGLVLFAAGELDDGAAARCDGCLGAFAQGWPRWAFGGEPVSKTGRGEPGSPVF
jgi:hypothetical protein